MLAFAEDKCNSLDNASLGVAIIRSAGPRILQDGGDP
jgi:hypothetical protein